MLIKSSAQFQRNFTEKNVKNLIGDELNEVSLLKNAEKIPALFVRESS